MIKEKNIPEMFVSRAKTFLGRTALRVKKDGTYHDINWEELYEHVRTLAQGLAHLGLRKDDKVILLSESRAEWLYYDLAILSIGAVTVPLFPTYKKREVEYIIKHSEARGIIISSDKHYNKIERLVEEYPNYFTLMSIETIADKRILDMQTIQAIGEEQDSARSNDFMRRIARIQPEDLASIIYTSGTTGPPKGVMLTHNNFLSNCHGASGAIASIHTGNIALSVLPLSHVFERLISYMYLYKGIVCAFAENLNTLSSNLQEVRPHLACFVPRIFEKFYHKIIASISSASMLRQRIYHWAIDVGKQKYVYEIKKLKEPLYFILAHFVADVLVFRKIRSLFGGRIKFFISGGAKLSREIARYFYAVGILITEGYGLTETAPVVAVNRVGKNKFGTVGPPLPNVKVRIAEDGEILIKGPNVMKGYFKDEHASEACISEEWLYTGDIGVLDDEGFLKITDRKKDIIVASNGKNIAPQNIENSLTVESYISQAYVCGDGEKYISALLVPDFDTIEQYAKQHGIIYKRREALLEKKEVLDLIKSCVDRVNENMADYERVKKYSLLEEEFSLEKGELTPTMKMKRSVIYARYKAKIEAMYRRA